MSAAALTDAQERFAALVARGTGLEVPTVRTWVLSEGGPGDNPLNIMQWIAGQRSIRHYGTPEQAAAATVTLLRNERYAGVLSAAGTADVSAELAAIAVSPWEENRYRGATDRPGALLDGAHARLYPAAAEAVTVAAGTAAATQTVGLDDTLKGAVPLWFRFLWDRGKDELNPVDDTWFAKGFLHVALTALALLLFYAGLNKALNGAPAHVARTVVTRGRGRRVPADDDIPF